MAAELLPLGATGCHWMRHGIHILVFIFISSSWAAATGRTCSFSFGAENATMINSRSCALGEKSFRNGEEIMLMFMLRCDQEVPTSMPPYRYKVSLMCWFLLYEYIIYKFFFQCWQNLCRRGSAEDDQQLRKLFIQTAWLRRPSGGFHWVFFFHIQCWRNLKFIQIAGRSNKGFDWGFSGGDGGKGVLWSHPCSSTMSGSCDSNYNCPSKSQRSAEEQKRNAFVWLWPLIIIAAPFFFFGFSVSMLTIA